MTVIKFLIGNGAKVNLKDAWGWTPLMTALANTRASSEVIKFLIMRGAKINEELVYKSIRSIRQLTKNRLIKVYQEFKDAKLAVSATKLKRSNARAGKQIANTEKLEQEIANLTQQVDKLEAQQAWNKFQDKKREQKRMRDLLLGKYRTK